MRLYRAVASFVLLRLYRVMSFAVLSHGDFPGAVAAGGLEQIDAARQVDGHVIGEVVDVANRLTCNVIDDGAAHVLAAFDEDAAFSGNHLQGLVGVDAGQSAGVDGDDVGGLTQVTQTEGLYIISMCFAWLTVIEDIGRSAAVVGREYLSSGFVVLTVNRASDDVVVHFLAGGLPVGGIASAADVAGAQGGEL